MQKTVVRRAPVLGRVNQEGWNAEELEAICRSILQSAFPAFRGVDIAVHFHPYVGLTHTLRRSDAGWALRISDHCRHAPSEVLESIALILGCKVMRRKPPRQSLEIYQRFRLDPAVASAVRSRRKRKGRKQFSNGAGTYHSPEKIYDEMNGRYSNGQIEVSRIGWGLRRSMGRLGHYDPVHHTITLSPVLDSPSVPSFVVRYIVYHEMLHALIGDRPVQEPRRHHPPEFRRMERAYPDYAEAREFLGKFCAGAGMEP